MKVLLIILLALPCCARDYSKALYALARVESGGNPQAIGDRGKAVGLYQMWPVQVRQCNIIAGKPAWKLSDRKDPWASHAMVLTYLRWQDGKHPEDTDIRWLARWRNPHGVVPTWYTRKLQKELK